MGEPTPKEWYVLGDDCGADDVPYIEIATGACPSPEFESIAHVQGYWGRDNSKLTAETWRRAELIAAAGNTAQSLEAAGYNGLETLKALPELLRLLSAVAASPELSKHGVAIQAALKLLLTSLSGVAGKLRAEEDTMAEVETALQSASQPDQTELLRTDLERAMEAADHESSRWPGTPSELDRIWQDAFFAALGLEIAEDGENG